MSIHSVPKVTRALLKQGKASLKAKQPLSAMEALDRLLSMEPDNQEALSLVSGLERRKRLGQRMVLGACMLGVVLLALAAAWVKHRFWPSQQNDPAPNLQANQPLQVSKPVDRVTSGIADSQTSLPDPSGMGRKTSAPEHAGQIPSAPTKATANSSAQKDKSGSEVIPKPSRQAKAQKKTVMRDVIIRVNPYFDKLYVDDKLVAVMDQSNSYGMAYRTQLAVGSYRVRIQNKMCFDLVDKLTVVKKPRSKQAHQPGFRLEYKPASLRIVSELEDTSVWVDGKFSGVANDKQLEIPISGQTYDRTKGYPVRLKLAHPVAGELHKTVYVRPNQKTSFEVQQTDFQPKQDGGTK